MCTWPCSVPDHFTAPSGMRLRGELGDAPTEYHPHRRLSPRRSNTLRALAGDDVMAPDPDDLLEAVVPGSASTVSERWSVLASMPRGGPGIRITTPSRSPPRCSSTHWLRSSQPRMMVET